MTMGTTGSARQDELRAIETELAGHATFGDARRILDRRRAFALLRLETAFRDRPPVRSLCKQLRDERHRKAAADVFADPPALAAAVAWLSQTLQRLSAASCIASCIFSDKNQQT